MKHIVIVESPAKAKTIQKYLGPGYQVFASYGHVRDLKQKNGAVRPEDNFAMDYEPVEKNKKHINAIAQALKKADSLLLATDRDREGEVISLAVLELMQESKALTDQKVERITFNEITKKAIQEALKNPRAIDMDLVYAQQARRALDYLVGFNLSPLLWKKVRRGLSAGRVQSPALRMITERDIEIEQFVKQEYWSIHAYVQADKNTEPFRAKLQYYHNEKLSQFSITEEQQAKIVQETLLEAAKGKLKVIEVERKQRKRNPAAPFTTSTLQQEASRKLGMTAQKTMRVAQQLYEGVDIGQGETTGLITYMRTDSVSLAEEALVETRQLISERYGKEMLPRSAHVYKSRSKNAQEAHEAIRPTAIKRTPEQLKDILTNEQFKLYSLIWKRTVACQMIPATIAMMSIDLSCSQTESHRFRATGSTIENPGFISVYQEDQDDIKDDKDDCILPPLKPDQLINLDKIEPQQHFTEPPPRYSEASLVKALEEHGIGRPSTYASIISTLQQREYVFLEKKRFFSTDVGRVVNHFLTNHFPKYVDYDFTANLENELDAIARGEKKWLPVMDNFWQPFHKLVDDIDKNVSRSEVTQEKLDESCPECNSPLSVRLGKRGRFIGCTNYPECKYTRNLHQGNDEQEGKETQPEEVIDRFCPKCQTPLQVRHGRYGKFIGCSGYPKCKYIESLNEPTDTQIDCPECKEATLQQKKSRFGTNFYSCANYPKCRYAISHKPIKENCPSCQWPILMLKSSKRKGLEKVCPQKDCNFSEVMPVNEEE